MKFLLDTNTCVGWLRLSQPAVVARIKQEAPTDIVFCSVVLSELIYGVERATPAHQSNNRLRVTLLRQQFASIPFDDSARKSAAPYGRNWQPWERRLDPTI